MGNPKLSTTTMKTAAFVTIVLLMSYMSCDNEGISEVQGERFLEVVPRCLRRSRPGDGPDRPQNVSEPNFDEIPDICNRIGQGNSWTDRCFNYCMSRAEQQATDCQCLQLIRGAFGQENCASTWSYRQC